MRMADKRYRHRAVVSAHGWARLVRIASCLCRTRFSVWTPARPGGWASFSTAR
jgi:hypothetical protein